MSQKSLASGSDRLRRQMYSREERLQLKKLFLNLLSLTPILQQCNFIEFSEVIPGLIERRIRPGVLICSNHKRLPDNLNCKNRLQIGSQTIQDHLNCHQQSELHPDIKTKPVLTFKCRCYSLTAACFIQELGSCTLNPLVLFGGLQGKT